VSPATIYRYIPAARTKAGHKLKAVGSAEASSWAWLLVSLILVVVAVTLLGAAVIAYDTEPKTITRENVGSDTALLGETRMADGEDGNLGGLGEKERIDIILEEYKALRAEVVARTTMQSQRNAAFGAGIITVLGLMFANKIIMIWFIVIIFLLILCCPVVAPRLDRVGVAVHVRLH
jgi:uncharacterized membrane protein